MPFVKHLNEYYDDMSTSRPPAVVLTNLGSPDTLSEESIRSYLRALLSDRNVVNLPPLIWQPILRSLILPRRPRALLAAYQSIWDHHRNASPLLSLGWCLTDKVASRLQPLSGSPSSPPTCYVAMQYSAPSLESVFTNLATCGHRRILFAGLYPQHAGATQGALRKQVQRLTKKYSRQYPDLEIEYLAPWYNQKDYIEAIATQVRRAHRETPFDHLLVSFHGLPKRAIAQGDKYQSQCEATFQALAPALADLPFQAEISYQSRFGPTAWTQPYTGERVRALARHQTPTPRAPRAHIAIINPGFPVDCLETLYEVGSQLLDEFQSAGGSADGQAFVRIPCLNASDDHARLLARLIHQRLVELHWES